MDTVDISVNNVSVFNNLEAMPSVLLPLADCKLLAKAMQGRAPKVF